MHGGQCENCETLRNENSRIQNWWLKSGGKAAALRKELMVLKEKADIKNIKHISK